MKKEPKFIFTVERYNSHLESYLYFKQFHKENLPNLVFSSVLSGTKGRESTLGWYQFFLFNNIEEAKKHFYMEGRYYEHEFMLPSDFHYFQYSFLFDALLSDEPALIKRIPTWSHPDFDLDKMSSYSIFSKGTQAVLADDTNALQTVIEWFDKKLLPKKEWKYAVWDREVFAAFLERDKARIEAALQEMLVPKVHRSRNRHHRFPEYISYPALGYAKLAWLKGIEVAVNNPLVPQALLPVQPLEEYPPYPFVLQVEPKFVE